MSFRLKVENHEQANRKLSLFEINPINRTYFPEVDGLRAIAIIPVVLYHAGIFGVHGGFIGVDVFFVISGFLISQLILSELASGSFRLTTFWMRRIRRLLPAAAFLVVLATPILTYLLPPKLLVEYAQSVIAQALFSSNFLFWQQTGYFDVAAAQKPLLHTWSLAVEEQFYLLFPFLLLAVGLARTWILFTTFLIISLLSLAISVHYTGSHPSACFYLLPSRLWELGLGALTMLIVFRTSTLSKRITPYLGFAGLSAILISCVMFNDNLVFPGYWVIIPCLSTALVLLSIQSGKTHLSLMLAHPLLVYVGKISYSLYLWHWMIFSIIRAASMTSPTNSDIVIGVFASFILASISYHFIEQPTRRNRAIFTNRVLLAGAAVYLTFSLSSGMYIYAKHGFPQRLAYNPQGIQSHSKYDCHDKFMHNHNDFYCKFVKDRSRPFDFAVWGDSHAKAAMEAFEIASDKLGINFIAASLGGCPPSLGLIQTGFPEHKCDVFNQLYLDKIIKVRIKTVFLIARFYNYYTPRHRLDGGTKDRLVAKRGRNHVTYETAKEDLTSGLTALINRLHDNNVEVYVLKPVPTQLVNLKYATFKSTNLGIDIPLISRKEYEKQAELTVKIAANTGAKLIDLTDFFCDKEVCRMRAKGGQVLYKDHNHMSPYVARELSNTINALLSKRKVGYAQHQ